MTTHRDQAQDQDQDQDEGYGGGVGPGAAPGPGAGGNKSGQRRGEAGGARHRQHVFPGRENVVKVRYSDQECLVVARAADLTGLRTSGFVAAGALLFAQGLVSSVQEPPEGARVMPVMPVLGGRPVLVSWSAGGDREVLAELLAARLALRRYAVNVNQAVAALNSGGEVPVWLEQAVAGCDRAVARVDEATSALMRRLV